MRQSFVHPILDTCRTLVLFLLISEAYALSCRTRYGNGNAMPSQFPLAASRCALPNIEPQTSRLVSHLMFMFMFMSFMDFRHTNRKRARTKRRTTPSS